MGYYVIYIPNSKVSKWPQQRMSYMIKTGLYHDKKGSYHDARQRHGTRRLP